MITEAVSPEADTVDIWVRLDADDVEFISRCHRVGVRGAKSLVVREAIEALLGKKDDEETLKRQLDDIKLGDHSRARLYTLSSNQFARLQEFCTRHDCYTVTAVRLAVSSYRQDRPPKKVGRKPDPTPKVNVVADLTLAEARILDRLRVLYPNGIRARVVEDALDRLLALVGRQREIRLVVLKPKRGAVYRRYGWGLHLALMQRVDALSKAYRVPRSLLIRAALANLDQERRQDPESQQLLRQHAFGG